MTEKDPSRRFAEFLQRNEQRGRAIELAEGAALFEAGDPASSMYLVRTGSVELRFEHSKRAVPTGGFFGELALLLGSHRRSGSASANEAAQLTEFDRETFDELFDQQPRLWMEVLRHSCATLLDSERSLVHDLAHQNRALHETLRRLQRAKEDLDDAELAAHTDALTGLFNRRFLDDQIQLFLERADESGERPALVLFDLDRFKEINDSHGHACGDFVLRRTADRLKESLRRTDMPYRIGGDEFAVLLLEIGPEPAVHRAKQLARAMMDLEVSYEDAQIPVNASIGATQYRPGESWSDLYDRADRSLYLVKRQGGGELAWEGEVVPTRRADDSQRPLSGRARR